MTNTGIYVCVHETHTLTPYLISEIIWPYDAYRQRGQAVDGGMGVVVQEMVEANAAGVLFSLDPVTGSPATITITANYGLGEVDHPETMVQAF